MIVGMIAAFGLGGAVAAAATSDQPPSNPGSPADDCSHGNSSQTCKDDPQPDHGKDCEDHGQARGNEDHCDEPTDTTDTTDTTHTDTTDTTHTDTTETTHTDTTETTHTDTTETTHTDTTDTSTTDTTPTESTPSDTTATETTAPEETTESEPEVFTPPTSNEPAKNKRDTAVAGVVQGPSDAAQAPPLTP
jgi:hypothetical protein